MLLIPETNYDGHGFKMCPSIEWKSFGQPCGLGLWMFVGFSANITEVVVIGCYYTESEDVVTWGGGYIVVAS